MPTDLVPNTFLDRDGVIYYPSSVFDIVGIGLAIVGQIAVGIFTRGRELAADRAAATALGDPRALAAALERLANATEAKPSVDLRRQARATNAITVLPPSRADRRFSGLFSTHPPVETRLAHLRSLVA
ncbi:M48 family metalloprotease [Natrinema versiforme]|uniref:M48 family metalloprotease n=1 Tax=Natrinema versiforme TaxID=88724 RepID=UPI0019680C2D|nr:M48 family metalloprotease [Natrinema versiforme]